MVVDPAALFNALQELIPLEIIAHLNSAGHLYLAGGAVRDYFAYKKFKYPELDFLVTGLELQQLLDILNRYGHAKLVGKSFAVIKFCPDHKNNAFYDFSLPSLHQEKNSTTLAKSCKITLLKK